MYATNDAVVACGETHPATLRFNELETGISGGSITGADVIPI
jgi:hypothetical protein